MVLSLQGFLVGYVNELELAAESRLSEPPEVGLDDRADLRIAASRLGIRQLDDWLSAGRELE